MRPLRAPARGDRLLVGDLLLDRDAQVGERGAVTANGRLGGIRADQRLRQGGVVVDEVGA